MRSHIRPLIAAFAAATMLLIRPALLRAEVINITPCPMEISASAGNFTLTDGMRIGCPALPDSMRAEAQRFATTIYRATGLTLSVTERRNGADFLLLRDSTLGREAYRLSITPRRVTLRASTATGLFYALQTVKKLLPPGVMMGLRDPYEHRYVLPALEISDAPRFAYRGFMLDVSRHFFPVSEVKRMLDIMAAYNMNAFHWHLTDDQGWRAEIAKYPRLTTVGATAADAWMNSWVREYRLRRPYGPFFYTRAEMEDVVSYARERHITVIPEIDMPGHFQAAMAAYPEYSCTPAEKHEVWTDFGISTDVLNVASPAAVNFARDILTEIAAIFPSEYIHIGGDECPLNAWQANAECRAMVEREHMKSFRELQSRFIALMAEHLRGLGRKIVVWNEAITAPDADMSVIRSTGATVFCWYPAVEGLRKAASNGLDCVFTPWGPYYINRRQSKAANEPIGAGNGSDNLKAVYAVNPIPRDMSAADAARVKGVQATFWSEHVSDNNTLEYLALPRLMAVAEAGWSPEVKRDFRDFTRRMSEDRRMWDMGHYNYGRHFLK